MVAVATLAVSVAAMNSGWMTSTLRHTRSVAKSGNREASLRA
jgi:hypothetical protein